MTIKPEEDFAGRSISSPEYGEGFQPEAEIDPEQVVKILEDIVVCFAGHEAEAAYRGRRNWRGSTHDFGIATDLALYLSGGSEEASALLKWRRVVARGVVLAHGREVAAVATALLERETLIDEEVREAIRVALRIPAIALTTDQLPEEELA